MNSQNPTQSHHPLDVHAQLDDFCERLRKGIELTGHGPIEELLQEALEPIRERLFQELVAEDAQLRQRRGEKPTLAEYLNRFPDRHAILERILDSVLGQARLSSSSGMSDTSRSKQSEHAEDRVTAEFSQFGPYRVLQILGEGTFGQVFKCQHNTSGSIVAVKMLKPKWANDPKCGQAMRKQFADEARTMLAFDHPHVVRVISLDERGDPPYFVEEFIDGTTLRGLMQQRRLPLIESLQILVQIADALAHIHSREKWHRDLKPENILLDAASRVHIADFGLVLDDAQRWHSTRSPAGTYRYMAPEQVQGATHLLNSRCDLWAVGVIAYELFTGTRPFHGTTIEQLRDEILQRTPTATRDLNPSIPRRLNRLCMQCLAKRDADRPDSAADLREDFLEQLTLLRDGKIAEGSAGSSIPTSTSSIGSAGVSSQHPDDSTKSIVEYPIPTLRRFTAEQAELYLRLMPKSFSKNNPDELPELIAYWKQRILCEDADRTFRIGIMVGVSGCGKSSLLEAGLVPQLPPHIKPVLIEASEADTEVSILKKLRRLFPQADTDQSWSLSDWTFRLRSGELLSDGHKVVFILDQFEQWLNVHGGEPTSQLLDALHQCDGEHLQTIVCVREGFHATLMRFVQSLRLVLDEDANYATAHRFSRDHALFVLEQFGRGLTRLDNPITSQQREFLEATINGLSESDRGVVCVRLVVLASVMSDRLWTVAELDQLGGLDGIGCQFLVNCFEGRTASEQYRRYLPAAMRVLGRLLPAEGHEIKDIRGYNELWQASELDAPQFDDLLNILTRKLFLVTLVEQDVGSFVDSNADHIGVPSCGSTSGRAFQLTHDFLVPALREWLTRKQRETRKGRAELTLEERSSLWRVKQENRFLPSFLEWISIRSLTSSKSWTELQRAVMHKAARVHLLQGGSVVTALLLLGVVIQQYLATENRKLLIEKTGNAVETIRSNSGSTILFALNNLKSLPPNMVRDELQVHFARATGQQKLSLAYGLASIGQIEVDAIVAGVIDKNTNGAEVVNIVEALKETDTQALALSKIRSAAQFATVNRNWKAKARLAIVAMHLGEQSIAEEMLKAEPAESAPQELRDPFDKMREELAAFERLSPQEKDYSQARLSHAKACYYLDQPQEALKDLEVLDKESVPIEALLFRALCLARLGFPEKVDEALQKLEVATKSVNEAGLGKLLNVNVALGRILTQAWLGNRDEANSQFENLVVKGTSEYFDAACIAAQLARVYGETDRTECNRLTLRSVELLRQAYALSYDQSNNIYNIDKDPDLAPLYGDPEFRKLVVKVSLSTDSWDPEQRAEFIAEFPVWCGELGLLAKNIERTNNAALRSGISLAVGSVESVAKDAKEVWRKIFEKWYVQDSESGPHSAADWALRQWQTTPPSINATSLPNKDRTWWLTPLNLTMVRIPAWSVRSPSAGSASTFVEEPFWISDREISIELFKQFLADVKLITDDAEWRVVSVYVNNADDTHPMRGASWEDAVMFCNWLSEKHGLPNCYEIQPLAVPRKSDSLTLQRFNVTLLQNDGFRLPTSDEWEYACRARTRTSFSSGDDTEILKKYAVFGVSSPSACGSKLCNPWGLFDMHGNVNEWCWDAMGSNRFDGTERVLHGGQWSDTARGCTSRLMDANYPTNRISSPNGFRVALGPQVKEAVSGVESLGR